MKKYIFILFFLFQSFICIINVHGQDFSRSYINKYYQADYFLFEDTKYALNILLELHKTDMDNANINFLIGASYMNLKNHERAYPFLLRALPYVSPKYTQQHTDTTSSMFTHYYLGIIYQMNYRFEEAIYHFNIFKYFLNSEYANSPLYADLIADLNRWIETSHNAKVHLADKKEILIENIGAPVNTKHPEYAPVLSNDGKKLFFTSRRPENIGRKKDIDGKHFEDIYTATFDKNSNTWTDVKNMGKPVNTKRHEAALSLSYDGKQLFIYRTDRSGGNIYVSYLEDDGEWSKPKKLSINSRYWESHACLSPDGQTLYFSSNRPGGYGGTDIYKSHLKSNGDWSKPINLGPTINSEYDEDAPYVLSDGKTLFFASRGHNSMGGFDVFTSKIDVNGNWSEPENLGFPINTTGDDLFYYPTTDPNVFYYSSVEHEGFGDMDIYKVTILEEKQIAAVVKGSVLDEFFLRPVNAQFSLKNISSGKETSFETYRRTGEFYQRLDVGNKYELKVSAEGYDPKFEIIDLSNITTDKALDKIYYLRPRTAVLADLGYNAKEIKELEISSRENLTSLKVGSKVVFKNVFADAEVVSQKSASTIDAYRQEPVAKLEQIAPTKKPPLTFADLATENSEYATNERKKETASSVGDIYTLKNVLFSFDQNTLSTQAVSELDNLVHILKNNPRIRIEISGHTDNIGSEAYNKYLSRNRAKVVCDYLTKNGIPRDRLEYAGYGFERPITTNTTSEGRHLNRRTEIKILAQ